MYRLGLTGSMATGKSFVLQCLEEQGIPVYSADAAVHDLYENEAVEPVEALFPGVVSDGVIDRVELSRRLVAHPERLVELESVVHPLVRTKMMQFLDHAGASGADIAVLEIPILYETGTAYPLDAVAVTTCEPGEQRKRAMRRPGMTGEKFKAILARQMSQEDKKARADFVIDTTGTYEATRAQVVHLVKDIRSRLTGEDK